MLSTPFRNFVGSGKFTLVERVTSNLHHFYTPWPCAAEHTARAALVVDVYYRSVPQIRPPFATFVEGRGTQRDFAKKLACPFLLRAVRVCGRQLNSRGASGINKLAIDREMFSGPVDAGFILALLFHHGDLNLTVYKLRPEGLMRGMKIPPQDFALKMQGGGLCVKGGAYLRDTTVLGFFQFSNSTCARFTASFN